MANKNFVLNPGSAQVPPVPNVTTTNAPTLTAGQTVNVQTPPPPPVVKKTLLTKLIKFGLSIIVPSLTFFVAVYLLSRVGVSPIFCYFVGYILGLIFLAFLDSAWESDISIGKPVFIFMTLLLFYNLSVKYLPEYSKNFSVSSSSEVKKVSSETGNLRSVGDIWFTDEVFKPGKMVKIEITYNNVKMVGGEIFSPGVYNFPTIGKGCLMFEGVIDKPAQVKISY